MIAAVLVALVGGVVTVIGFARDAEQAYFAYLAAYGCAFSTAAGALVLVLIGNATHSRWFLLFRRTAEALAAGLVVLAVGVVPLVVGRQTLYPWARSALPHDPIAASALAHQKQFLNTAFFGVRAVIYFAVLIVVFAVLRGWSRRQDVDANPVLGHRQRAFSAVALPPVAFAITFASFDWLMSLTAGWFSSVFGIYVWVGGFDAAIALTILLARKNRDTTGRHFSALGRMQLAFVIFWAYIAYAQGFIIWIANKPSEVVWYIPRFGGGWGVVAIVLGFLHFVVPFALLLPRMRKYSADYLAVPGIIVLCAHVVDSYWMVMPTLHPDALAVAITDAGPYLFFGGVLATVAFFVRRRASRLPEKEIELPVGLAYEPQP